MKEYVFKYRRIGKWMWSSVTVTGHQYSPANDKISLFLKDGSIHELPKFSELEIKLGTDWVLVTKEMMEKESGQDIKLNV